jgi:hypothetical protein
VEVRGGHDDAYRVDRAVYFAAIQQLLDEIAALAR